MKEKRYFIECPYCGKEQYCTKSIFHCMGVFDMGGGNCLDCDKHFQIIYDPQTDTMKTRKWEEFEQEIKEKKEKKDATKQS